MLGPKERADLIRFLRRAIEVGQPAGVLATTIDLVEKGVDNTHEKIDSWAAPFIDIKDMVREIEEGMTRHKVGSREPVVIFSVRPYYGGATNPTGALHIKEDNSQSVEPDMGTFLPTEGLHPKGLLGDMRKFMLEYTKLTVGEPAKTVRELREELAALREENRQMRAEGLENYRLQQDLLNQQMERRLMAEKAAHAQKMKEDLLKVLVPWIPIILNRIKGERVLPESIHPDIEQLKIFLGTLTDDDIPGLMQILGPRAAPIFDLVQRFKTEHEAEQAKRKEAVDAMLPKVPEPKKMGDGGGGPSGGLAPL